jgi:hypothetical protein
VFDAFRPLIPPPHKYRPHIDANEVIVTGTFDQASPPAAPYYFFSSSFLFILLMPSITTGLSLRLPSFIFSSAPHLCIQWSSSIRLTRKPDGFEAPILIPWQDKIAYKFIVDGRWMTNDAEPTEIDHGFINNVYTAPQKPPLPAHQLDLPSHRPEPEVQSERAEKVPEDADKPVSNGSALDEPQSHEVTPAVEPAPEEPSSLIEGVKAVITPTSSVEAAHVTAAQVAPDPQEVERAPEEVRVNSDLLKPDLIEASSIKYSSHPNLKLSSPRNPSPLIKLKCRRRLRRRQ